MSIPYAVFIARAMRSILKDVLERVVSHGIHEPNAIYIRFMKNHPGVDIPDWTRQLLDAETTIVLQHDFRDLSVTETGFSVTLKFSGVPARLRIPFTAVLLFSDPGANLQLVIPRDERETTTPAAAEPQPDTMSGKQSEISDADGNDTGQTAGKVISLANFRK